MSNNTITAITNYAKGFDVSEILRKINIKYAEGYKSNIC